MAMEAKPTPSSNRAENNASVKQKDGSSPTLRLLIRTMHRDLETLAKKAPIRAAPLSLAKPSPEQTKPAETVKPLVFKPPIPPKQLTEKGRLASLQKEQQKELAQIYQRAKALVKDGRLEPALKELKKITGQEAIGWWLKFRANHLFSRTQKQLIARQERALKSRPRVPVPPKQPETTPPPLKIETSPLPPTPPAGLPVAEEKKPSPMPKPPSPPPPVPPVPAPPVPVTPAPVVPVPIAPAPAIPAPTPPASPAPAPAAKPTPPPVTPKPSTLPSSLPAPSLLTKLKLALAAPSKTLFLVLGFLIVASLSIGGWFYWQNLIQPSPLATPSPTLSPSPTPLISEPPVPQPLFEIKTRQIIELKSGQEKNLPELLALAAQADQPVGQFTQILFKIINGQRRFLTFEELMTALKINLFEITNELRSKPTPSPAFNRLKEYLNPDRYSLFLYSQAQDDSSPFSSGQNQSRAGLTIALKDEPSAAAVKQLLRQLEPKMLADLTSFFLGRQPGPAASQNFLDNTYQGVAIRYLNLPFNNLTIDYAVLGDKILLTTSKESMYAAIDQLLMINNTQTNTSLNGSNQNQEPLVLLNEVGCGGKNLFVLSTISGKIPVDESGNYKAEFSSQGAQLVFLTNDQGKMCASAISLPKNSGKVYFNAESTAKAFVFQTVGILSIEPQEAEERLTIIEQLKSFSELYVYIKTNLPKQDFTSLLTDSNFENLLQQCVNEALEKLSKPF